jgi:hypothetical protein
MRSFLSDEGLVFPQGLAGFRSRLVASLDLDPNPKNRYTAKAKNERSVIS